MRTGHSSTRDLAIFFLLVMVAATLSCSSSSSSSGSSDPTPSSPSAASASGAAPGQSAVKTVDNPKGGKIVYGPVAGQTTEAGAMGAVLRKLHNQYGDRPQVGKVFQVRGTKSVAAFFTLVKRNQGNGKLAGMVIVSKVSGDHVEAAVMTDDASRFGSTINPMLTKLLKEWKPASDLRAARPAAAASQPASLHPYTLSDRSASVSLPDGWKIEGSSQMGTIYADGPNGEGAELGYPYGVMDTNNAAVQRTMNTLRQGGLRNTSYARALYYPYGGDLAKAFVDLNHMLSRTAGKAPVTYNISGNTPVQAPAPLRCVHLTGGLDVHDGKGMKEMNTVFCTSPPGRFGGYMDIATIVSVPLAVAPRERATVGAIMASFNVDQGVTRQQAGSIAAPAIRAIHEIGRQSAQAAANAHAAEDVHNRGVEKMWDERDKGNQAFSNYLLEQTVIQDNYTNTHSTEWNDTADELVKRNPDRYEYVPTPNFWKGVDY